jgi:hypothetical protein
MTAPAHSVPLLATDPGFLLWAPLGSTIPTDTVTGSVFTDAWDVAWVPLGSTDAGHNFNWQTSTSPIEVAEYLDPLQYKTTGRAGSISFALANFIASNWKRMLNGGTLTASGTGATSLAQYSPPATGAEVRSMIGWESEDHTERLVIFQCFNTGQVTVTRQKGAAKAVLPVEFSIEQPAAGGAPFRYSAAGAARAA